jgi:multiple sugar transport system substrate-binding protein
MMKEARKLALYLILVFCTGLGLYAGPTRDQSNQQVIRVLLNAHPWQEAIEPHLEEFTAKTGIKVEFTVLGEDIYWDRVTLGLSAEDPPFDVFMLSPNQTGFVGYQNNWIAPLDDYINQASDFDDIYPFVTDGFRYPNAQGKIYGVPLTMEVYMMFYRKDILAEQGINVASLRTMDDWMRVLARLDQAYKSRGISAAVIRGQDETMPDELLAAVNNNWGSRPFLPQRMFYFDQNWNTQFLNPAVINGFETWAKILSYGPPGATSFTWYDCTQQFMQGKAITFWFDASLFAGMFEDPTQSLVAGKVGYAPIPPTATGNGTTHWAWGLSITSKSRVKDAAWEFINWATSKEMEQITAPATYGPVRESTWAAMAPVFGREFSDAVDASLKMSAPGYMYFSGAREVCDRIIDAVIDLSRGADTMTVMRRLDNQAKVIVQENNLR